MSKSAANSMFSSVLEDIHERHKTLSEGQVADYIPALAKANPEHFGIALLTANGDLFTVGETEVPFTVQSISKPFILGMALDACGPEKTYQCVGTQPISDAFNSITLDETTGRPFNPMLNAGAIALTALIHDVYGEEAFPRILTTLSNLAGRQLDVDEEVYTSEKNTGFRNRAMAYLMRNTNILNDPVEEKLDLYFRQCSIRVTARDLAVMAATLANIGKNPLTSESVFGPLTVRHVISVMFTCGMYNYAGQWAVDIGLPAKSGVSGGIMATVNRQLGIGIYSPPLDQYGNSVRGLQSCIDLVEEFGLHPFEFTNAGSGMLESYI